MRLRQQTRDTPSLPVLVLVGGVNSHVLIYKHVCRGASLTASWRRRTQGLVSISRCRLLLELSRLLTGRKSPGARHERGKQWGPLGASRADPWPRVGGGPAGGRVRGLCRGVLVLWAPCSLQGSERVGRACS